MRYLDDLKPDANALDYVYTKRIVSVADSFGRFHVVNESEIKASRFGRASENLESEMYFIICTANVFGSSCIHSILLCVKFCWLYASKQTAWLPLPYEFFRIIDV